MRRWPWREILIVAAVTDAFLALLALAVSFVFDLYTQPYVVRRLVNGSRAARRLEWIADAQDSYRRSHGTYGTFDKLTAAGVFDKRFSGESPQSDGYRFRMEVTPGRDGAEPFYRVNADPLRREGIKATGTSHFYLDSSDRIVRVNRERPAGPGDPRF